MKKTFYRMLIAVAITVFGIGVVFASSLKLDVVPDGTSSQVYKGQTTVLDVTAQTPVVYNTTLTNANTEYSRAFSDETTKIMVKARDASHVIKITFTSGESGSTYLTIPAGNTMTLDNIYLASKTIYMQSTDAGAVVEILAFN